MRSPCGPASGLRPRSAARLHSFTGQSVSSCDAIENSGRGSWATSTGADANERGKRLKWCAAMLLGRGLRCIWVSSVVHRDDLGARFNTGELRI